MADPTNVRREELYEKLKRQFKILRATLDPHLDVGTLADNGVDVTFVDLSKETYRGGAYFIPMSQSRLESLDQRPNFDPVFSMDDYQWNYSDGYVLASALANQLLEPHEETLFRAIETTKWQQKGSALLPIGLYGND
jgi:hypothetical protein